MKKVISFFVIILLGWLALTSCQGNEERKLFVFRHAEKIGIGDDPDLTQQGLGRSEHLAKSLATRQIGSIYSTPTARTRATVAPLAKMLGLPIMEYNVYEHDDLLESIRSGTRDVVVVGHSNTIHHIANYFRDDLPLYDEIDELDYDTFFEVDLKRNTVERKRFSDL